ncbi:Free methionine-R-sulfoxide reductase [Jeotgalicoccus saudimassiliensis]|uniref:Free methionine-R-sulfoxide reductase n=1 Tax=Jeotgalicoccus saudimassiliensis TaxID=1461582 RepID=A0A078M611_9STAP|nr:GAF domain-containing protein [Jeotgalicoccus saudimassiliensis]CEA00817.1 Free methionine-R-sulfoxide reductase [Jeotgalicoccus saudimassiliensis]
MFTNTEIKDYETLNKMLKSLIEDETDRIANLSNASALLNVFLKDINWVGFYLYEETSNELVLGPFQGLPACVRIENGKGVCGTAFRGNDIFIVDDVNEFPGHIACDAASKSEIVLPLYKDGKGIGVLDIDAPVYERFTEEDRKGLKAFTDTLINHI